MLRFGSVISTKNALSHYMEKFTAQAEAGPIAERVRLCSRHHTSLLVSCSLLQACQGAFGIASFHMTIFT